MFVMNSNISSVANKFVNTAKLIKFSYTGLVHFRRGSKQS